MINKTIINDIKNSSMFIKKYCKIFKKKIYLKHRHFKCSCHTVKAPHFIQYFCISFRYKLCAWDNS